MAAHKKNTSKVRSKSVGEITQRVSLLSLNKEQQETCSDIPLLTCTQTKTYISRSKIMVIMKGLPGSGKSTVVKSLSKAYRQSLICSADRYFERNKKYKYDSTLLTAAHTFCQQTAIAGAQSGDNFIIIDNTNLQHWEMKFYIDLADRFNYVVFVIEPQTPWRKDAKLLAQKNSHGLDITVLKKKLKCYEDLSPLYFGWFLNESDSYVIKEMTRDWLEKALQVSEFKDFISKYCSSSSLPELLNYFSGGSYSLRDNKLLHCTSKYSAKEDQALIEKYMKSTPVLDQLGAVSSLVIVAFIITPNTYGARVMLSEDQLKVWDNDKSTDGGEAKKKKKRWYPPQKASNAPKFPLYAPDIEDLKKSSKVLEDKQGIDELIKFPLSGKGLKAHFTLGTAAEIPPAQTGLEMLELLQRESETTTNALRYDIPGAVLIDHENKCWGIYPTSKITVEAFFSYQL